VEHVLVWRRDGRRRSQARGLGEWHGAEDTAKGEEGQRHLGDAQRKVAQVSVLTFVQKQVSVLTGAEHKAEEATRPGSDDQRVLNFVFTFVLVTL
jgi:hypothetical protein